MIKGCKIYYIVVFVNSKNGKIKNMKATLWFVQYGMSLDLSCTKTDVYMCKFIHY